MHRAIINGLSIWGQTGDNATRGVATDASNNIIVTGNFSGTVNFNPLGAAHNLTASGTAFFIAKYNTNGQLIWVQPVNGNTGGSSNICVDSNDNIYADGSVMSTLVFPTGKTINLVGSQDLYLAKFASDGTFQFAEDMGGSGAKGANNGIAVGSDNNIYISGYFSGNIDFDPSPAVALLNYHGQQDFFLVKYNTNGAYQWAVGGGSANCNQTFGRAVGVDSNNDVLLSGAFCSTVNFDVSSCTSYPVTAQSNIRDSFLAKYVANPSIVANNVITVAQAGCVSNIPGVITGTIPFGGTGTYYYQWQNSNNGVNFANITGATLKDYNPGTINSATYLQRTVTSGTCTMPLASNVIVLGTNNKVYSVSPDATICPGGSTVLNVSGGTSYQWLPATGLSDPNAANPIASPTATTTYTVLISDGACSASSSVTITLSQTPTISAGADLQIKQGESVKLNGSVVGGDNVQYQWSPTTYLDNANLLNPSATPTKNTTYILTATYGSACTVSDSVFVKVYDNISIPNTFTPNADGINDTWNISALNNYSTCLVNIYNRYGIPIFKSIGYPKAWDGNYNNKPVPAGTYYYTIDLKDGSKMISGWVAVLR